MESQLNLKFCFALQDIIRTDRESRLVEDKLVALKQEQVIIKKEITEEDKLVNNLKHVLDVVDKLLDPLQDYSLGQIGEIFRGLLVIYNYMSKKLPLPHCLKEKNDLYVVRIYVRRKTIQRNITVTNWANWPPV